jgi:hypothetical protein
MTSVAAELYDVGIAHGEVHRRSGVVPAGHAFSPSDTDAADKRYGTALVDESSRAQDASIGMTVRRPAFDFFNAAVL